MIIAIASVVNPLLEGTVGDFDTDESSDSVDKSADDIVDTAIIMSTTVNPAVANSAFCSYNYIGWITMF